MSSSSLGSPVGSFSADDVTTDDSSDSECELGSVELDLCLLEHKCLDSSLDGMLTCVLGDLLEGDLT